MPAHTAPQLSISSSPAREIPAPRGPLVNADWIIRHYHTDPDTNEATVSQKWIRETVPGKIRLSHSRVGWYRDDVIAYYEQLRKAG